jgi:Mg2+ and Co2+ transporter CorA
LRETKYYHFDDLADNLWLPLSWICFTCFLINISHRESWRMKLDSARNHMMLVNLWLSMLAISLMLTTAMPSFFGMNVKHGFEEDMWYFYAISGVSTLGEDC